jgi:dienelactone hydrolase
MKQLLLVMILALLVVGCETTTTTTSSQTIPSEASVKFTTIDGWTIQGVLYNGTGSNILLLHGLGDHNSAWAEFARVLKQEGYTVLAIDLRGHGKSTMDDGINRSWQGFTTRDFSSMANDASAAQQFLGGNITIMGASIGANIAVNYAASSDKVTSLVLFSPGLDYKGITAEAPMKIFRGSAFFLAGDIDTYSASSAQRLYDLAKGKKKIEVYKTSNHGTQLLSDAVVQNDVLSWLEQNYPAVRPVDNSSNITVAKR